MCDRANTGAETEKRSTLFYSIGPGGGYNKVSDGEERGY